MKQILAKQETLIQDYVFPKAKPSYQSTADLAECYVCGKGIQDGFSLTAKKVFHKTELFCEKHYS